MGSNRKMSMIICSLNSNIGLRFECFSLCVDGADIVDNDMTKNRDKRIFFFWRGLLDTRSKSNASRADGKAN